VASNRPWTFLQHRVVSAQIEAARRRALSASQRAGQGRGLGTKLTGDLIRLDKMAAVWPDTVAVVFSGDSVPELRYPGDVVVPKVLPGRNPTFVLPVTTSTVIVDVEIANAVTYDGQRIDQVVIRVSMHLSPVNRYAAVASLAAEFGKELADFLLRQVKVEVAAEVEAAIRLNRLADLRRSGLEDLLADRWLPRAFAGGALLRDSFEVRSVRWPEVDDEQSVAVSEPVQPGLHLTVDARLQLVWKRFTDSPLWGIAGAQAGSGSTVIAVPDEEPPQYETGRLREEYAKLYHDKQIILVAVAAHTYPELVREWFRRVDTSPARLISVDSVGDDEELRIHVRQPAPPEGGRPADPGSTVGTESARAALAQLLPHRRVEFIGVNRV
jgi:hypothetical protein